MVGTLALDELNVPHNQYLKLVHASIRQNGSLSVQVRILLGAIIKIPILYRLWMG